MKSLTSLLLLGSSLLSPVLAAGNPATFWSDYPTCEEACHQSVWSSQSCSLANSCSCAGCLCLADSCLCETSSWLTAVAQCIGQQCGSAAVTDAAGIAASACVKNGYPLVVPSASLVSIGLAALPTATGESVPTAVTVAITDTPTSATSQPVSLVATKASTSASFSVVGANPATTSDVSVSGSSAGTTPAASSSSGLSTGAKAGIGVGAALAIIIILSLLAFIFYQRRRQQQQSKAKDGGLPSEGRAETTGLFELGGGAGKAASGGAEEKKNPDGKRAELQGGGYSPVSMAAGGGGVAFPEKGRMEDAAVAEMLAPLSEEERMELERRRRAADLSAELQIPVEPGIDERSELEARRRVYEIGSSS